MMLKKWNYKSKTYEPYAVPDEWNVKTYCEDMDEIINCPHCGKKLTFGESYTSHEIHTAFGIGYGVCEKCYFEDENERYYAER